MADLKTNNKEIIALNTFEAVRKRPTMYISQIALMDDKLPIIKDNKLVQLDKLWSPGFMHLIIEILENAIDEAKRMKGKMKSISVNVNLDNNEVSIKDSGGGFYKANTKHSKTKKNVVRTAFEELHAGSNFIETTDSILGTNGVGSAVCNILSENFEVTTVNKTHYVRYVWKDYKVTSEEIRAKTNKDSLGTEVKFSPSKEVFNDLKWDKEIIETYISFKQYLLSQDKFLKTLTISGTFVKDGKEIPMNVCSDFLPANTINVVSDIGNLILWPSYQDSCSISFVNGSQCVGIHQKIVQDWLNDHFKYNLAHHFYETLISLNVPSMLMKFADQNKSKYAISRTDIEPILEGSFKTRLLKLIKGSPIASEIEQKIEDRMYSENIKIIKKAQKTSKRKISDKYAPASKHKERIFLCEGISSMGSIRQARDSEREAVYALKGKIKNTKKLSDLTTNQEILEIMSVLGLDPSEKKAPTYDNVVIATDEDCIDENHIIITNNGNKKIKDITYDDKVLTHTNEFKSIKKIVETIKTKIIKIEINGNFFICSEHHTLIILRDGKIEEIEAKFLKKTDFILLKK